MEPVIHITGILFGTIATFSWAGANFCIKPALRDVAVPRATATVTILNALFVALVTLIFVPLPALSSVKSETWFSIIIAGILHFGISRICMNAAIYRIGPNRTIPVANSFPLVTAFLATLALGEPLTMRTLLGLALLFSGLTFIVRAKPAVDEPGRQPKSRRMIAGWVFAGLTSLLMGVSAVFFKKASLNVHPLMVSTLALLTGAGVAWLIAGVPKDKGPRGSTRSRAWFWLLASAVCQSVAIPFYNAALTKTLAVHVTSLASAQPLVAIPMGLIFMREAENISLQLMAGAVLAVGGTLLVII